MRFFAVVLILLGVTVSHAQTPEVPHKMRFADLTLTIRDDARREIQKDVDAMTKSPKYFGIKVERAKTYFPLIEKIFAEERLPDDFKYLALQESALVSDAVSVSNAVGFWQFKDYTAMEMGMRVDDQIDERMNIISSSRGAAKYLKQNNYMFNNWLFALQAYQMGAGGVQRLVGDKHNGEKHMEITSETYWYVKKFIAHKVAFEDAVKGDPLVKVQVYELKEIKNLSDLASELGMEEAQLKESNKWVKSATIPNDRPYSLLVPNGKSIPGFNTLVVATATNPFDKPASNEIKTIKKEINGVAAIQALPNESITAFAIRAHVSESDFLKFNDISTEHTLKPGDFYFVQKKKTKSAALTHTLADGEDLWAVSQRFGVVLKKLQKFNRPSHDQELKHGEIVWLNSKKPLTEPVEEKLEATVEKSSESEFFDWEINPASSNSNTESKRPTAAAEILKANDLIVDQGEDVEERPGIHRVAKGESWYSISMKYQVSINELVEWNNLAVTSGLHPGQEIRTAKPSTPIKYQPEAKPTIDKSEAWAVHEVKAGDTLHSVARQYNVTIKEIMDWNSKANLSLTLGERLKILTK